MSSEEHHAQPTDSNCRMRCRAEEHIKHIVGCTTLAPSEYTNRHDKVAGCKHWTICKHRESQVTDNDYEHVTEMVINADGGTTIVRDVPVIRDGKTR